MEMNALVFMNDAREKWAEQMAVFQGWEDEAYKSHLKDIFNAPNYAERKFDSFEIAAVVAASWRIENSYRTEYARMYNYIKEFLVHPFTCTIKQIPGESEGKFEYLMEGKTAMVVKEVDESACATMTIDLFVSKLDKYLKVDKLLALASELRTIYK